MASIIIKNSSMNNLKNISLTIPLNKYVVFVGKSGSGKTTLAVNVIVGGCFSNSSELSLSVKPVLFRQTVSIPSSNISLFKFITNKSSKPANITTVKSVFLKTGIKSQFPQEILLLIVDRLDIGGLDLNKPVSELSLTTFNKIRFFKLLLSSDAKLFVIDELGAGLTREVAENIAGIFHLMVNAGYSVIAIEHSLPIIKTADYVVELGPDAGIHGGKVIFCGPITDYKKSSGWLSMIKTINQKLPIQQGSRKNILIKNINYHSFSSFNFAMPLDGIVNICGETGSGKSTLIDVVFRAFDKSSNAWKNRQGIDGEISGKSYIRRPYIIDQSPIGNNSMSTPATYTKIMDILRNMYVNSDESKRYAFCASDFSYNADGKCLSCGGKGVLEIKSFDDVIYSTCETCKGTRYSSKISKVKVAGLNIGEALLMPCDELLTRYSDKKNLSHKIGFINEVGLSYLTLGQPSGSLSGGESQRIKITKELAKSLGDRCLFILDTPSKGLHIANFEHMISVLRKLVGKNNTVLICDNNPYFINNSDWVVYLDDGKTIYEGVPSNLPEKLKNKLGIGVKF